MSDLCGSCSSQDMNNNVVDLQKTSDDIETLETVHISYGSGSVYGQITEDRVSFSELGGQGEGNVNSDSESESESQSDIPVFNLSFLALYDTDIDGLNQSGLIGLAQSSLKTYDSPTFMDVLVDSNIIDKRIFMFNLDNTNYSGVETYMDGVAFGTSAIQNLLLAQYNSVQQVPLSSANYYSTSLTSISLGSDFQDGFSLSLSNNSSIIFDTGSSLSQIDSSILEQVNQQLLDQLVTCGTLDSLGFDSYACTCSQSQQDGLGDLRFGIGGTEFLVPKGTWMQRDGQDQVCIVMLVPSDGGPQILGDSFLKQQHVIFDQDEEQVGLLIKGQDESVVVIDGHERLLLEKLIFQIGQTADLLQRNQRLITGIDNDTINLSILIAFIILLALLFRLQIINSSKDKQVQKEFEIENNLLERINQIDINNKYE